MSIFTNDTYSEIHDCPYELTVCPYSGIKRVIFDNYLNYNNCKWSKCMMFINDMSTPKKFEVNVNIHDGKDSNEFGILLRPSKKYEDALFEQIFGFKCKCIDFDDQKTIGIRSNSFTFKIN